MATGKCNLLKPVDSLTGTFFIFSQYAQDLTKQYSAPDTYRCIPSKFIALNLDYSTLGGGTSADNQKIIGETFQNYFENICTFYREDNITPEDTLYFLFQTFEKYQFINTQEYSDTNINGIKDCKKDYSGKIVSGVSPMVQYIGDINIYSYDNQENGIGYNEIYCYIPNDAKCIDYQLQAADVSGLKYYQNKYICGYENQISYNDLSWKVENKGKHYTDKDENGNNIYGKGEYTINGDKGLNYYTLVPSCLFNNNSNDKNRTDDSGNILEKFEINTIVLLYDIVAKTTTGTKTLYKNIPLGIYFTGTVDEFGKMSNIITKYVNNEQIYNQGTSYGLRVCTRFLATANTTEIIESTTNGSTNIAEMAPVLEKIGETLIETEKVLSDNDKTRTILKEHLAQFKNNKVNVPYVRTLGDKKYWFVNGKNTGAIAQYEQNEQQTNEILTKVLNMMQQYTYSKSEIGDLFDKKNYVEQDYLDLTLQNITVQINQTISDEIEKLRRELIPKEQE